VVLPSSLNTPGQHIRRLYLACYWDVPGLLTCINCLSVATRPHRPCSTLETTNAKHEN